MNSQIELIAMTPGETLRLAREQQGLTIELAASKSRIRESVITAIETGETEQIPSVYLRGYIRNYARFLGVASSDLEEQMESVRGAEPDVRTVFTVKGKRNTSEKWLKASSYLAASALIATLAWQFTHEAVQFSQGESKLVSGTAVQTEAGEAVAAEFASEAQPANTHLNASIASVEVLNRKSDITTESAAEKAWEAISLASDPEAGEAPVVDRLSITTSADTWVEIADAAGNQLELDLIRAGTSREYRGQPPFDVMIGRSSAVVLNMNGSDVDLGPHTRGNVARLTLNPQ